MRDLLPASSIVSRVSSPLHWRIHVVSSKFNVLRRSHPQSLAISVYVSISPKIIFGYRSSILVLFFSRKSTTSSGRMGSSMYVLHRDSRALITVKLGFSVVAPMRVMIPFSTHGRRTSCCDLDQRWISSRNNIVCCPEWKLFCALEMIFTTSSFFERTHERWKNSASSEFAITRASEVFPHPGGHQRRIDGSLPASMNLRIDLPTHTRCCWPTRSSSCSGLRSEASGVMDSEKRDCMALLYSDFIK